MRCLSAILAGLWLATASLAGPEILVLSGDPPESAPAACAPGADLCPDAAAACGGPCGPAGRFWVSAEFLYWHANGSNAPPLLTTSPAGTALPSAGVLGAPGTSV